MTAAEISIIPEFKSKIEALEVPHAFNVNKSDIVNKITGNEILFRGIKTSSGIQTANLKSIEGISCWCNDESEELVEEDTFDTIDLSIRTKNSQNRVILILNPSDKSHWIYRRWIDGSHKIVNIDGFDVEISTHPDVLHIHTSMHDNKANLDDSFLSIVSKMREESPSLYGHKIIGQWRESNEGSLFPKSKLKYYDDLPKQFDCVLSYIDAADEGSDYLCMVTAGLYGQRLYVLDIVFSDSNADITLPLCVESAKKTNATHIRVESNAMGAMYKRILEQQLKGVWVGGATSTQNKFARIYNDSIFIHEYIYYPKNKTPQMEAALTQMAEFTRDGKAKHDDAADAMSGLSIFARGMFKHRWI
jgi:PBSX family phage terminase large subunit